MAPPHTTGARVQALSLLEAGIHIDRVSELSGISKKHIYRLRKSAKERGYNPTTSTIVHEEFVIDKPRSGRPKKITEELEKEILAAVRKNRKGREKTSQELGWEFDLCDRSIVRTLHKHNLHSCKPSFKPGLTESMKAARLKFALEHQSKGLEFWKNVIWTDETSVVLGHRRGAVRVWRTPQEQFNPTVVRPRWKGASEFIFWGCFSYDKKGPCHIWKPETPQEKEAAKKELDRINAAKEPEAKADWELRTALRRLNLRRRPGGPVPTWKFTEKEGAWVRKGKKGGIDWYRYQKVILIPKLIPFAKECMKERPETLVQEDGAPSHIHHNQHQVFLNAGILRLLWPGNSPDLNAIEPCWPWMKKKTTRKGAPNKRQEMEKKWLECWEELEQSRIQAWIERIPNHIDEIILLKGDNNYREGRKAD